MQTEKKNLNKREKRMLMLLVVVAIFAGMVLYVITPLYNQLNDKKTEYNDITLAKMRMEASVAAERNIRENRDLALGEHAENSARFLSESLSNEIGRMLTALCARHGLQPIDQNLSAPGDFSVDGSSGDDAAFLVVSAAMTVSGDYARLKSLLDDVAGIDYLRVKSVSFSWSEGLASETIRVSLNFEVSMLKNLEF